MPSKAKIIAALDACLAEARDRYTATQALLAEAQREAADARDRLAKAQEDLSATQVRLNTVTRENAWLNVQLVDALRRLEDMANAAAIAAGIVCREANAHINTLADRRAR
jgi:predicted nuclease with TOPRIM domain